MVKIYPTQENGLIKESSADTFQIRSVSTARFIQKMGEVSAEEMYKITQAVGLVIEYS